MSLLTLLFRGGGGSGVNNSGDVATGGESSLYALTVAADNPVLWYRMHALSGTVEPDLGTVGQPGTYINSPTLDASGALTDDPAVTFAKASSQQLEGTDNNAYSITATGFTVEFWAKFTAENASVAERIFAKYNSSGSQCEWAAERLNSGAYTFRVFPGTSLVTANASFGTNLADGAFHHFVATVATSGGTRTVKTYLDGELVDTETIVSGTYSTEVLADSPRGYWKLNESSGNLVDSSGNAHTGTPGNAANITYQTATTVDTGLTLSGLPDTNKSHFDVSDHADFDVGDTFTLEAWLAPNAGGTGFDQSIIDKGPGGYQLTLLTDFTFRLQVRDGTFICTSTQAIPTDSLTHHVVATKNGSTVKLYLDGVDVSGTVVNDTIVNTANDLRIGATTGSVNGNNHYKGVIDEVAVYPTALSATRVKSHFQVAVPILTTGTAAVIIGGSEAPGFNANATIDEVALYSTTLSAARILAHYSARDPGSTSTVTGPQSNVLLDVIFARYPASVLGTGNNPDLIVNGREAV